MPGKYLPRSDDPWDKEEGKITLINKINFNRFAEPTCVIALTTVIFYYIISNYYISYYNKLSIPFNSLNLPLTFYLFSGSSIAAALIIILLTIPILAIENRKDKNDKKITIFSIDIKGISRVELVFYGVYLTIFIFATRSLLSSLTLLFNLWLAIDYSRDIDKYKTQSGSFLTSILVLMFCITITGLLTDNLGKCAAEDLIKGQNGLEVKLNLSDENLNMSNKPLMLVLYNDRKFYLVEKNESVSSQTNSYIIPDDQVKMMTLVSTPKEKRKLSNFYSNINLI